MRFRAIVGRLLPLVLLAVVLPAALSGCTTEQTQSGQKEDPVTVPTTPLTPGAPVVAFYGDSYTLGTGASDPSRRWSTTKQLPSK